MLPATGETHFYLLRKPELHRMSSAYETDEESVSPFHNIKLNEA
jgi:hypothetical protein